MIVFMRLEPEGFITHQFHLKCTTKQLYQTLVNQVNIPPAYIFQNKLFVLIINKIHDELHKSVRSNNI